VKVFAVLLIVFSIVTLFTTQPSFVPSQQPSTTSTVTTTTTHKGLGWLPEPVTTTRTTVTTTRTYPPLPERFDWTDYQGHDWVTPIRDQGGCGSCVAFATVGVVEAQYRIYYNRSDWNIDLSEQHLFSCGGGQCSFGWYLSSAMDYMRDSGTPDEACYPYGSGDGNDRPCSGSCPDWSSRTYKISGWNWVNPTVPDIEAALMTGPVLVAFTVHYDFFSYTSGIYHWDGSSGIAGGHAVVIVGYDNAYQYWKVKNSWGPDWGENGFFRIGFGEGGIEDNVISASLAPPVTFNTNPSVYPGMPPSTVSACGGIFTDGQSTTGCGRVFSATGNPPSETGDWMFNHWEWGGGVSCTSDTENPANCTATDTGTLKAVYSAKVTFYTNPSTAGSISWGACSEPGRTNGQYLYDQNLPLEYSNQVTACANVPQGYTFSGWSCDGGLSCSGSSNPTAAVLTGPGSITAVFNPPSPPVPSGRCVIATAAYGSSMAPEVLYMRNVRDQMIASTTSGRILVDAWNGFYYSWSPPVASAIAANEWTQRAFRVLLTPLVGIIHATAAVYSALAWAGDTASILAFATAVILSTTVYVITPALVIKSALKHRRSRGSRV